MSQFRTLSYLLRRLQNAGLPHNKKTLFKWEAEGRLVCPRSPTNSKKIKDNRYFLRMFTEEQVEEIIKAFSPGGTGTWKPN